MLPPINCTWSGALLPERVSPAVGALSAPCTSCSCLPTVVLSVKRTDPDWFAALSAALWSWSGLWGATLGCAAGARSVTPRARVAAERLQSCRCTGEGYYGTHRALSAPGVFLRNLAASRDAALFLVT